MTVEVFKPTLDQVSSFQSREEGEVNWETVLEGPVCMVTIEEKPLAIYHATQHMTCIELHAQVSKEVSNYKHLFQEMSLELISEIMKTFKNYDLFVMDVEPRNKAWAESLGFQLDNNVEELETLDGRITYSLLRGAK